MLMRALMAQTELLYYACCVVRVLEATTHKSFHTHPWRWNRIQLEKTHLQLKIQNSLTETAKNEVVHSLSRVERPI